MRTSFRRILLALALTMAATASLAAPEPTDAPLLKNLRGKVVLLDFWASWCGPCRHSFPWMNDLQKRHGNEGLVIVAVNMDQDRKLAERFLNQTPAQFRVEYDGEGALATRFDVTSMPESVLIDRNGRVRELHKGFRVDEESKREQSILQLLKE